MSTRQAVFTHSWAGSSADRGNDAELRRWSGASVRRPVRWRPEYSAGRWSQQQRQYLHRRKLRRAKSPTLSCTKGWVLQRAPGVIPPAKVRDGPSLSRAVESTTCRVRLRDRNNQEPAEPVKTRKPTTARDRRRTGDQLILKALAISPVVVMLDVFRQSFGGNAVRQTGSRG